ncbi:amidohydrolase family protein [Bacillus mobilis]|uniref:amidohydrolase family protein n=1 Tax=Bacillus mobilis TaxID=2026190 RepID=UPI00398D5E95
MAAKGTDVTGTDRIDVHQHIVPPGYSRWLVDRGLTAGGMPLPAWSAEGALAMMDDHGIRSCVMSVSTPGVHLGDDAEARDKARYVNEYAAEQVKDRPDRFGFFATLTLPDVDGALAEIAHSFDVLGADGVVLLANVRGAYPGDPAFDPVMTELDRRGAVVLIHPSHLPGPGLDGAPPFLLDFLLDTSRAVHNLVRHGAMRRWTRMRIILSHGGGFVPYAAHRMAYVRRDMELTPDTYLADLRKFYFDTALSTSPVSLPSLLAFADPTHIVYGSDWPYAPLPSVTHFSDEFDKYSDISDEQRTSISHGNAVRLFPRFGTPG